MLIFLSGFVIGLTFGIVCMLMLFSVLFGGPSADDTSEGT